MLSTWGILTGAIIIVTSRFFVKNFIPWFIDYRNLLQTVKGVGGLKPHWLLGHLQWFQPTERSLLYVVNLMTKFPKCMQQWFGPFTFYLGCYHPDVMKPILMTEEPKDDIVYRFLRPWIGDGLLTSSGKKWKRNRRLLTPAFHFEMLKGYLVSFNDAACEMLQKWSDRDENVIKVEMFREVALMTLDNLLRCILSKRSNCQLGGENRYLQAVKYVSEATMKRLHNPFFQIDFIFYMSPTGRKYKSALKVAHDYTENAILERKSSLKQGTRSSEADLDFLDIMLMAKDEDGIGLSHQEICDEVDTFVFEGHDTVSSAISWAFYNLAVHTEYQERCRQEVASVLGERKRVKWEDLSKFNYLTMFIKESMRVHPPVFGIGRKTSKSFLFPRGFGPDQYDVHSKDTSHPEASKTVPKNFNIGLSFFMLHRNPYVWKSPDVFDPERFTPENIASRSPHAYLPFSSGPRNCIGQNFAMNEMKVVLALALARFRFAVDDSYPKPELEPHIILRSKSGIHIKLEKL